MMAGAGQIDSPTCEVNASNSPRFDINEFLKTPKDAVTAAEEQYFNFATFNLPGHNSTSTTAPTLRRSQPGAAPPAAAAADPADFSTLLATINDGSGYPIDHHSSAVAGYPDHHVASDTLIAFDEIDADTLFSAGSHVHDCSSVFGNPLEPVPACVPSPGHRLPYTWAYMVEDLPRPDDRACGESTVEHAASTTGGAHHPVDGTHADWGMAGPTQQPPQHFGQTHQQHQQFQCASCHILRRIIHSNGMQDTKLEIHGCDGQSYHAVLQTRFCIDDGFPSSFEQQMVEFPVGNAEYVKQFLLQYSLLRRKEGFVLKHDSLTSHGSGGLGMAMSSERVMGGNSGCMPKQMGQMVLPNVFCTSSDLDFSKSGCAYGKAGLGHNKIHNNGSIDNTGNVDINIGPARPPKSNAAAQRERTGKLKMMDLAQHFHLPINAAAKELGICPTVLKKICRRNGMRRWPHRKIKSIERIIATLEQTIAEGVGQGDEGICMEIAMLRNERAQLCAGFLGES